MTFREFIDKWELNPAQHQNVDPQALMIFLSMLDYLSTSRTKEQVLALVEEYYNEADNIFNSSQYIRQEYLGMAEPIEVECTEIKSE